MPKELTAWQLHLLFLLIIMKTTRKSDTIPHIPKDFYILLEVDLSPPKHYIASYNVVRKVKYNSRCLAVACDTNYPTVGSNTLYVYADSDRFLYTLDDKVYLETNEMTYDLLRSCRGVHITADDVANFANKIKYTDRAYSVNSVKDYGNTDNSFYTGGGAYG